MARRTKRVITRPRRRRRKRYLIDWKRFALCVVSLALLVELAMVLLSSPQFAIDKVRVSGNKTVPTNEIIQRISFARGTNIFRISHEDVRASLTANAVIASTRIHRQVPRTLLVEVAERKPHFTLFTGTAHYVVDRAGIPFRVVKTLDPSLPVVCCRVSGKVVLGKPLRSASLKPLTECLLLAQTVEPLKAAKITVDQSGHLCLNVRDKFQVRLGRPEDLSKKFGIVERVLKQVPEIANRGEYIDVSCVEAPAYKLAKPE